MGTKKAKDYIRWSPYNVGGLMSGGFWGLTDNEKTLIKELKERQAGTFLTPTGKKGVFSEKNKADLEALLTKGKRPFELGESGKDVVLQKFFKNHYGMRNDLGSLETIRAGLEHESAALFLFRKYEPKLGVMLKNEKKATGDYFSGYCDHITKDAIDISKFNIKANIRLLDGSIIPIQEYNGGSHRIITDTKVKIVQLKASAKLGVQAIQKEKHYDIKDNYYTQVQCYMSDDMYNAGIGCVVHVLMKNPDYVMEKLRTEISWQFGGPAIKDLDMSDDLGKWLWDDYLKKIDQIEKNNDIDKLPLSLRIKPFFFEYNPSHINELKHRIDVAAWPMYDELVEEAEVVDSEF